MRQSQTSSCTKVAGHLPLQRDGRVLPSLSQWGYIGLSAPLENKLPEGISMPIYEYLCSKCRKKFTLLMSINEHDAKKVRCPKCKSVKVEQQFKSFFTITSKKS